MKDTKTKKQPVQIVAILDMSGSMSPLQTEVINSFNYFIEEQKKLKGKAEVTLVLFDNNYEVPFEKVNLKKFNPIDSTIYKPRGMTSLYDAIGKTVAKFENDKDVVMMIQTDGEENSSQEFTQEIIQNLLKQKEADGWDISFLGANIDAKRVGASIGVALSKSVQYTNDANGLQSAFACMNATSMTYRNSKM